jgi:hypothetical protein
MYRAAAGGLQDWDPDPTRRRDILSGGGSPIEAGKAVS